MSVLKVPASNLSWHLLTTLLKAALRAAVKDLSAPLSLSKTVFEREGRKKKAINTGGKRHQQPTSADEAPHLGPQHTASN